MGITALVGASLGSAVIGASAAKSAAKTQSNAATSIAANQTQAGYDAAARLQPYVNEGQVGMNALNSKLGYLTTPYAPTRAQLASTPGYQFTLDQGLKSTQNAAAARGLGISGAALKGVANYATGLANNTYATNAGIYQQNQNQIGNLLTGMVAQGGNAAAGQGNFITGQANNAGQTGMSGAQAAASGMVGAANALTGGINNAANNYYQGQLVNSMLAQNGGANASDIASMHNLFKF